MICVVLGGDFLNEIFRALGCRLFSLLVVGLGSVSVDSRWVRGLVFCVIFLVGLVIVS